MTHSASEHYQVIVMGGSAGSTAALSEILPAFPADYPLPIIIVQHLHPQQDGYFVEHFSPMCALTIQEADEKSPIEAGHVYFAPPNYHLLVEADRTFSLSVDERVNYSRPSIDVLFESAADVYAPWLIGVILTGANNDGADGLRVIKEMGGLVIVQDPKTAENPYMPKAALQVVRADYVLGLAEIGPFLVRLVQGWLDEKQ